MIKKGFAKIVNLIQGMLWPSVWAWPMAYSDQQRKNFSGLNAFVTSSTASSPSDAAVQLFV